MSVLDEIEKYNVFDEDYSVSKPAADRNVRIRGYIIGTILFILSAPYYLYIFEARQIPFDGMNALLYLGIPFATLGKLLDIFFKKIRIPERFSLAEKLEQDLGLKGFLIAALFFVLIFALIIIAGFLIE